MKMFAVLCLLGFLFGETVSKTGNVDSGVAFSVAKSETFRSREGGPMMYDRVILNIGGGFDASTGKFVAPVSGLYHFDFHFLTMSGNHGWQVLNHNDEYVISAYTGYGWTTGSNSVNLRLERDDRVSISYKVIQNHQAGFYGSVSDMYASFSGFLIN
ncbi:cerebellin-3-like [Lingula anatina]|uniref:Cerebellin-3-like n=1 Tax=Lingula anatina TaxID=7574 RepID=A0A1S3K136_LINAN|nr:cerebellin-3-like [Lingula anatina]|eukprot:XP_013416340.1 cerebellin-3-like [Lingula anatina]